MISSDDKKERKGVSEEPEKQNERKNGLTCWLCKEKHQLMDCHKFKMNPIKERIDFAVKEKICKNLVFENSFVERLYLFYKISC